MTNKLSKEDITLLVENNEFAVRCLLELYKCQTADEQAIGTTKENNNVGFTGSDAQILSSFAEQCRNPNPRYRSPLSPNQFKLLRKKLPKYHRQLNNLLKEESQ